MDPRAEINRFAIFLFCLLVPLVFMAPTETSKSKMTTGQRQNHFTPEIPTLAVVIQQKAHELFEFYKNCVSSTFHPGLLRGVSRGREMAERIPSCPAFQASCCALHQIRGALRALRGSLESLCPRGAAALEANLSQLNTTLSQGTAFYSCQDLPQGHAMGLAENKTYIWWVLKRYEDVMQLTRNSYSEAAV